MIRWTPIAIGWRGEDATQKHIWGAPVQVAVIEALPRWNEPKFKAAVTMRRNYVWELFETEQEAKAYCEALYQLERAS